MSFTVVQNPVARDHRQRTSYGGLDDLFRHREHCDHSAGLSITFESFFCQSFTRRRPLQIAIIDTKNFLPTFGEDRRLDVSHAGNVRVTLSRDVELARSCFADYLE